MINLVFLQSLYNWTNAFLITLVFIYSPNLDQLGFLFFIMTLMKKINDQFDYYHFGLYPFNFTHIDIDQINQITFDSHLSLNHFYLNRSIFILITWLVLSLSVWYDLLWSLSCDISYFYLDINDQYNFVLDQLSFNPIP